MGHGRKFTKKNTKNPQQTKQNRNIYKKTKKIQKAGGPTKVIAKSSQNHRKVIAPRGESHRESHRSNYQYYWAFNLKSHPKVIAKPSQTHRDSPPENHRNIIARAGAGNLRFSGKKLIFPKKKLKK